MSQRNSAIELLRIVSMSMVLMVHFVGATFGLPTHDQLCDFQTNAICKDVLESISIVGVNCFVLISGYYGIHATRRRLLDYTLCCLFASLFVYCCRCIERGGLAPGFVESLLVYSKTDLWFVPSYLALFVFSPILNAGFNALGKRQQSLMLLALTFLNVYLGWFQGGKVNPTGYNVMQMIYIYYIGYYIRQRQQNIEKIHTGVYLGVYILSTLATALMLDFAYNSPFVLLSSAALFIVFLKIPSFCSPVINWVSISSFMVYLLHKNPYFWLKIRAALRGFYAEHEAAGFIGLSILLFVSIFICCILIDKVRIAVCGYVSRMLPRSIGGRR